VITGLDHVQVAAPPGCEAEARGFYGRLLGLPEIEKPAALAARGGVWFACGAQQLHVGIAADFTPASKAHPALAANELPALAERLTLAGAPVHWDDALPGVERFYTEDPWGNRLELVASG
jgi:catechol 2,3-dioxygenase-like lactoylglutathione lyase family enzyme